MRPPKRVLVTSDTATALCDALYLQLRVWGYRALDSIAPGDEPPHAVVAVHASVEHIAALTERHDAAKIVALVQSDMERWEARHNAGVGKVAADMHELRERLRTACARKRGPKPQCSKQEQECAA